MLIFNSLSCHYPFIKGMPEFFHSGNIIRTLHKEICRIPSCQDKLTFLFPGSFQQKLQPVYVDQPIFHGIGDLIKHDQSCFFFLLKHKQLLKQPVVDPCQLQPLFFCHGLIEPEVLFAAQDTHSLYILKTVQLTGIISLHELAEYRLFSPSIHPDELAERRCGLSLSIPAV